MTFYISPCNNFVICYTYHPAKIFKLDLNQKTQEELTGSYPLSQVIAFFVTSNNKYLIIANSSGEVFKVNLSNTQDIIKIKLAKNEGMKLLSKSSGECAFIEIVDLACVKFLNLDKF